MSTKNQKIVGENKCNLNNSDMLLLDVKFHTFYPGVAHGSRLAKQYP